MRWMREFSRCSTRWRAPADPLEVLVLLAVLAQLADLWTTSRFSMLEHEANPMARFLFDRLGVEEPTVWLLTVLGKCLLALLAWWGYRGWTRVADRHARGSLSASLVLDFEPRADEGLGANGKRWLRACCTWRAVRRHHAVAGLAACVLAVSLACWVAALSNVLFVSDPTTAPALMLQSPWSQKAALLVSFALVVACALARDRARLRRDLTARVAVPHSVGELT